MEKIKIGEVDVILEDLGNGAGKIIVASAHYNGSTYWGAMGGDLKDFLKGINQDYFANRLCAQNQVFDLKTTLTNVRGQWKEFANWYQEVDFQKDLRFELKRIEAETEEQFVDSMCNLLHRLDFDDIQDNDLRDTAKRFFCSEPWYFIVKKPSQEYKFYCKLLVDLQKKLGKS
jgi:hypothetical protein